MTKNILIFGGSDFQLSLIEQANELGLFTVVIDPDPHAVGQQIAGVFEVVGGQDYEGTCAVVEKYNIHAIITVATDKPLRMMARVAKHYGLLYIDEKVAEVSTDKHKMKEIFNQHDIPCAKGYLISELNDQIRYPAVFKPRDNSGSRGVIYCAGPEDAEVVIKDTLQFTRLPSILVEEVVNGTEYSIESLHYGGKTRVIQITEKITTPLPYYIELGHIQPPNFSADIYRQIEELEERIAKIFNFDNCGSHNEVKIENGKITVIEVSPRIGGDLITSRLVPLSTGVNMERALIQIMLGEKPEVERRFEKASGVFFFSFPAGTVRKMYNNDGIKKWPGVIDFRLSLKEGSRVPDIKLGTDRYGYFLLQTDTREELMELREKILSAVKIDIES